MKCSEIRILNKQKWYEITVDTLYNVHYILESTQVLLDINIKENKKILFDHPYVAAGLYTFAIEEFGKYLYLKSIEPINNEYYVDYWDEFRDHTSKFKRALSYLPENSKLVHKGAFGSGFGSGFDIDEIADFETRKSIFYSDFKNNVVQNKPIVDAKSLKKSVTTFFEITESELETLQKDHYKK